MPEKFEWKTELEDETIIRTHAWSPPGCHPVGCGLQLHVKDGKIHQVACDLGLRTAFKIL